MGAAYTGKNRRFASGFCQEIFHDSRVRHPTFMVYHRDRGDPMYLTGVMVHFSTKGVFVWPGDAHAPIGIKLNLQIDILLAKTNIRQISSRSVDIWENGSRKKPALDSH